MDILKKLIGLGLPEDIAEKLNAEFGEELFTTLRTEWLHAACEKAGIPTDNVPDIEITGILNAIAELRGEDVDGDGKTGVFEAIDTLKNSYKKD